MAAHQSYREADVAVRAENLWGIESAVARGGNAAGILHALICDETTQEP
jgi:hypothetical protein